MANNGERAKAIGDNVSKYRTDTLGMTQEQFRKYVEEETGETINRSTLSLIENGIQEPNLDMLIALAKTMRMEISELVDIGVKKYIVVDTNIILNCPNIVKTLPAVCDCVYIPSVVVDELNYQKDHGSEQKKKLASLCMSNLQDMKQAYKDTFLVEGCSDEGKINDDRIFALALEIAGRGSTNIVYILTNDKYFSLKDTGRVNNLKVIGSRDFDHIFRHESFFNTALSQKFYVAVKNRDIENAKGLAEKNVNINMVDGRSGFTPLIQAIRNKDYRMTQFLLSLPQIDINAVDNWKYQIPPISHAIQMNHRGIVELLIDNGANVNEPSKNDKNPYNTPLMIASWGGKLDLVTLLVENGACINQVDRGNGFTALIKAVWQNHPDIVKYLLEHNADRTICSFKAKTALDIAYEKNSGNRYKEIIELLDEKGRK